MFGPVSCHATSQLSDGLVEVRVTPPPRKPKAFVLRAPLPSGWTAKSVSIDNDRAELIGGGTVDLSEHTEPVTVRFVVNRSE
jgi:hypothetical protein